MGKTRKDFSKDKGPKGHLPQKKRTNEIKDLTRYAEFFCKEDNLYDPNDYIEPTDNEVEEEMN